MSRVYALYRGRSLLVFNGATQRDAYVARFMKFDKPQPVTEEEAAAWKPSVAGAKKIAIWQDEAGRWLIRGIVAQQAPTRETG